MSQFKTFWGLAPKPPLGDEARPSDPPPQGVVEEWRGALRIGGWQGFIWCWAVHLLKFL